MYLQSYDDHLFICLGTVLFVLKHNDNVHEPPQIHWSKLRTFEGTFPNQIPCYKELYGKYMIQLYQTYIT